MNKQAMTEALSKAIGECGVDAITNRKQLQALLADFLPGEIYRIERSALLYVLDIDEWCLLSDTHEKGEAEHNRAVNAVLPKLHDALGLTDERSKLILECFTTALGWTGVSFNQVVPQPVPAPQPHSPSSVQKIGQLMITSQPELAFYINSGEATIIGHGQLEEELHIPQKADSYPVTSVGTGAFTLWPKSKKVVIPEGVRSISNSAFCGASRLESISLPNSVTSIGNESFSGCSELKNIAIPNGLKRIGDRAFSHCKSLEYVLIPDGVEYVGARAFAFTQLKYIQLPQSLIAFHDSEEVFYGCHDLTHVLIPGSVKCIPRRAFLCCYSLLNITIPEGVEYIAESAFSHCKSLQSIVLPKTLKRIESYAFCECLALASLTIPESVNYIGEKAFHRFSHTGTPLKLSVHKDSAAHSYMRNNGISCEVI